MCDRQKKTKEMYVPQVNMYHDKSLRRQKKKKHPQTKAVSMRTSKRKRRISIIWKQKRKVDQKYTIVQMKEKEEEEKLILKIKTSDT